MNSINSLFVFYFAEFRGSRASLTTSISRLAIIVLLGTIVLMLASKNISVSQEQKRLPKNDRQPEACTFSSGLSRRAPVLRRSLSSSSLAMCLTSTIILRKLSLDEISEIAGASKQRNIFVFFFLRAKKERKTGKVGNSHDGEGTRADALCLVVEQG